MENNKSKIVIAELSSFRELSPSKAGQIAGGKSLPFVDEFARYNFSSSTACNKFVAEKSGSAAFPIIGKCSTSGDGTYSLTVGRVYLR